MISKLFLAFITVIVLIFVLGGCKSSQPSAPTLIVSTTTSTLSPTILAPSFTPSRTPTFPVTSVVTLAPDDAYTHLHNLLTDITNCHLPCWLGITPAQTTFQEVNKLLTQFGSIADWLGVSLNYPTSAGKVSGASLDIPYPKDNMIIEIRPGYLSSSDDKVLVSFMDTRSYHLKDGQYDDDVYDYETYEQLLKPYTLSGILSEYGPPTQIYIFGSLRGDIGSLSQTPDDYLDHFLIHLVYPDEGILMEYRMKVEGVGNNYRICPSNALISGYLMQSGDKDDFYKTVHTFIAPDEFWMRYPIAAVYSKIPQDAFGMTIEEFSQLFLSSPDHCLETPKSIWWSKDLWNELIKNP